MRQRRRWIRLPLALGSLAFVGVLFLMWQFLGLHFITKEETTNLVRAKQVYDIVIKDETTVFPVQKRLNLLRGSRVVDQIHYRPTPEGKFHCMLSGAEIAFEKVNDDFCDCPRDGSDEPGTSACSEAGRFFCTYHQRAGKPDVWVPAGKINDGICDCCDGSDEWKNKTLPLRMRLTDTEQRKFNVFQAPCTFTCF